MRTRYRSAGIRAGLAIAVIAIVGPQYPPANAADHRVSGSNHDARAAASSGSPKRTMDEWLDALSFAESGNRARIVHQDVDGRNYYGCLQFRVKTFRFFVGKFGLAQNAGEDDLMHLIYDCAFQKRLAARMMLENPESWRHWRKTAQRIGLPPAATNPSHSPRKARSGRSRSADNRTTGE